MTHRTQKINLNLTIWGPILPGIEGTLYRQSEVKPVSGNYVINLRTRWALDEPHPIARCVLHKTSGDTTRARAFGISLE